MARTAADKHNMSPPDLTTSLRAGLDNLLATRTGKLSVSDHAAARYPHPGRLDKYNPPAYNNAADSEAADILIQFASHTNTPAATPPLSRRTSPEVQAPSFAALKNAADNKEFVPRMDNLVYNIPPPPSPEDEDDELMEIDELDDDDEYTPTKTTRPKAKASLKAAAANKLKTTKAKAKANPKSTPKSVAAKRNFDSPTNALPKHARAPLAVNGGRRPRTYHKDQFDYTDFTQAEIDEVQARPARDRYKAWRNVRGRKDPEHRIVPAALSCKRCRQAGWTCYVLRRSAAGWSAKVACVPCYNSKCSFGEDCPPFLQADFSTPEGGFSTPAPRKSTTEADHTHGAHGLEHHEDALHREGATVCAPHTPPQSQGISALRKAAGDVTIATSGAYFTPAPTPATRLSPASASASPTLAAASPNLAATEPQVDPALQFWPQGTGPASINPGRAPASFVPSPASSPPMYRPYVPPRKLAHLLAAGNTQAWAWGRRHARSFAVTLGIQTNPSTADVDEERLMATLKNLTMADLTLDAHALDIATTAKNILAGGWYSSDVVDTLLERMARDDVVARAIALPSGCAAYVLTPGRGVLVVPKGDGWTERATTASCLARMRTECHAMGIELNDVGLAIHAFEAAPADTAPAALLLASRALTVLANDSGPSALGHTLALDTDDIATARTQHAAILMHDVTVGHQLRAALEDEQVAQRFADVVEGGEF